MEGEIFKEIIKLMDTELKHTFDTRQMIYDNDFKTRQAILALVHILISKGIISPEDTDLIWSCFESKEGKT